MPHAVRFIALLVAAAFVLVVPGTARAQTAPLTSVTYVTGTASNGEWVTFIAQHQGFFTAEGLKVDVVYAGSPPAITQAVATGAADVGHNGIDSWIAAVAHGIPVKIAGTMLGANTMNLVVAPDVKTWDDLKGKTVMLGTKQDITAVVLAESAAPHNLKLDDFSIAIGGNSTTRYAALTSGNAKGAVLTQPFDLLATEKGYRVLATAVDTMKDWTFSGLAVNPAWAAKNRPTLVKFLRALRKAVQYGYAHRTEAVADLVAELKIDPAIAQRTYDLSWTKWHAYSSDQVFGPASYAYMTRLQQSMGILTAVPPYDDVYDGSFVRDAGR